MKKNILMLLGLMIICLVFNSGCDVFDSGGGGGGGDDDDDPISWSEVFTDNFNRADTTYNPGNDYVNLGSNFSAYSYTGTGGIEITSNEVDCDTECVAEYVTPLSKPNSKLIVKFKSTNFSEVYQHGVYLLDNISIGSGCQVGVGYAYDNVSSYKLNVFDKVTEQPIGNGVDVTLNANTYYILEMIIYEGEVTATIKNISGTTLATTTETFDNGSCIIEEPSFHMAGDGNVYFDDFEIYTAD